MCVLCGEMMSSFHWSDVKFKEQKREIEVGSEQKERMQARLKRVKIVNEILEFYGLKLRDFQGSKYVLSSKKGRELIVNDLGDLWQKVSEIENITPNALDNKLIVFLGQKIK